MRNVLVRIVLVFAGVLSVAAAASAQPGGTTEGVLIPRGATGLEGRPEVRVTVRDGDASRDELSPAAADAERLRVRIADGELWWTSRDNRPLSLTTSGPFTYLSAEPGHYIRLRRVNDRIAYVEHVDSELGSVTYWGELRILLGR